MKTRVEILLALPVRVGTVKRVWHWGLCFWLAMFSHSSARTLPDPNDSVGFFTTVADKMLHSTFDFGVTNIPVCSNGVLVYSPAVQRILQLSANIYDATTTNFFPSVFRPCFSQDTNGNIFITGYTNVDSITGLNDSRLSAPLDVSAVLLPTGTKTFLNVYGVPWVIGAKKGLPNFNQFYMLNAAQVTHKLEVNRSSTNPFAAAYWTNQMYVISITNNLGISFWNSYETNYPRPLMIYATDTVQMSLSNGVSVWQSATNFSFSVVVNSWPGSRWSAGSTPPNWTPQSSSFCFNSWTFAFLPQSIYRFGTASFDPATSGANTWETTTPSLPPLPQFGLMTTNYLQAVILDGGNVIDYVQLRGPASSRNLNHELADPNYPDATGKHYQWSTNANGMGNTSPTWGVVNQMFVSENPSIAPLGNTWIRPDGMPNGLPSTAEAEAAFFIGFFTPTFQYNGQTYANTLLSIQAPYTPSRTIYEYTVWQVNDPLVHYLASDLTYLAPSFMGLGKSDDSTASPLPSPQQNAEGIRYQPWGLNKQLAGLVNVDTNAYNLAYKDPLVWGSDNWNFPTNLLASLGELGQVHRGTPWQTIYLKSPDLLKEFTAIGTSSFNIGTNTWGQWTGDSDASDAALMVPVNDRRLAGLLMSLLNTNDATQLLSVNDPNTADWLNVLNGLTVYSNSIASPHPWITPTFDTYVMVGNSPTPLTVVNGVAQARAIQPNQNFYFLGDILAAPELTVNSPWLNTGSANQVKYGLTDAAYEAIPAQLLPLLRSDSIGTMASTNGGWKIQFSGSDGYAYVLQTSTNLMNWDIVNTNYPVHGSFGALIPARANSPAHFYRSVLLP
jgi:hypothetical protein